MTIFDALLLGTVSFIVVSIGFLPWLLHIRNVAAREEAWLRTFRERCDRDQREFEQRMRALEGGCD